METDIRKSIKDNFKGCTEEEIRDSIISSLENKDEITLPGLGVFFEILWENSDDKTKEKTVDIIKNSL